MKFKSDFEKKADLYKEFCTGCGLCKSIIGLELIEDSKGYVSPQINDIDSLEFLKKICPVGGAAFNENDTCSIWGICNRAYYAFSNDSQIRKNASTAGILTSLAIYLLEHKKVSAIIQTCAHPEIPYKTVTNVSKTKDEILKCVGSRYSISSPLINIKQIIKSGETYAFIGKPCDVSALKQYMKIDEELKRSIRYTFSFFCAGIPSDMAQKKLLNELGCDENSCDRLVYRGNGWPGYAKAIKKNGEITKITYDESWGKILGRDVRKICRFCMDGIGNCADVSCGDAWYLDDEMKPIFEEKEGRNIVFSRNIKGSELIENAVNEGYITVEDTNLNDLKYIQTYQYERRSTMLSKICALKISKASYPNYSILKLLKYTRFSSIRTHARLFKGTILRIKKGVI